MQNENKQFNDPDFVQNFSLLDKMSGSNAIKSVFDYASLNKLILLTIDFTYFENSEKSKDCIDFSSGKMEIFKSKKSELFQEFTNRCIKKFKGKTMLLVQSNFWGFQSLQLINN